MKSICWLRRALLGMAVLAVPAPSVAQVAAPGTVTGHGAAELKKQPEVARLHAELRVKGSALPEALAKLKERRRAVQTLLDDLGAVRDSVQFGEPVTVAAGPSVPGAEPKPPAVVVLLVTVRAEWSLQGLGAEERLALAHRLLEKVRAAVLDGVAELTAAPTGPGADDLPAQTKPCACGCKPAEPLLLFVVRVSEPERDKALAEAFQKAERAAGRLARAAGADLGLLHHLVDSTLPADPPVAGPCGAPGLLAEQDPSGGEVVGLLPGPLTVRVSVSASFQLKKPVHP